ncbi:MAG: ATP-binding protein [Acidocella sp.]|uniref:ATP-binding protein n=1 Tax=Acidocella sp. TaxID=50710 RepID=UPI003FBE310A
MYNLLLRLRGRAWAGYSIAVCTSLLAMVIRLAIGHLLPAPFFTFIPAVIISTLAGGFGPGLLCSVLAAVMVGYFLQPLARYGIYWPSPLMMILVFLVLSALIITLTELTMRVSVRLGHLSEQLRTANEALETRIAARTAELMDTEQQLRQARKMEAIGHLIGGIAHDFGNLLISITGSLDMVQLRLQEGRLDELERHIAAARHSANRATRLTHRLLDFSRDHPLEPHVTDINLLIADMEELIAETIAPGVARKLACAPDLHTTLVDPNQMEHALLNLCINASDAMPQGGTLTIATRNLALCPAEAVALDLPPGDYVTLAVTDTGTGMPPEVLARAFQPFFTTKPPGRGTGLGLSMLYGFARQSGGHVAIQSTPGDGTTVTLYLPRHDGAAEKLPSPDAALPVPQPRRACGCILIADDEAGIRALVAEVLQDQGYTIEQAADARSALDLLRAGTPVKLLITDIRLPGMSGHELAGTARTLRPDLKILFMTGYAESAPLRAKNLLPGTRVLNKPFAMAALPPLVDEMLATPILGENPAAL